MVRALEMGWLLGVNKGSGRDYSVFPLKRHQQQVLTWRPRSRAIRLAERRGGKHTLTFGHGGSEVGIIWLGRVQTEDTLQHQTVKSMETSAPSRGPFPYGSARCWGGLLA